MCKLLSRLLVLCLMSLVVHASTFDQCLTSIRALPDGTDGIVDNHGNPVSISSNATAISYGLCKEVCGHDSGAFEWSVFSQQFSAWLLPWLALISQLPFGAKHRSDNVMSMLLTVGSPVLGAYSLALTVLNSQWIARRFSGFKYPNVGLAVRALSSLQQVPLEVSAEYGLLASMVVLQENNGWWEELVEGLDYIHTWSISAASSIAWVVIAYLFTVIDSFANVSENIQANGQGVGSVWLWLLPIVIGWLQVSPKCDFDRVAQALDKANRKAYLADYPAPVPLSHKTGRPAFVLQHYRRGSVHRDEESSAPIFNYARFFPWVHAVEQVAEAFEMASENMLNHVPVGRDARWTPSDVGVDDKNRKGTLDDVQAYCGPGPGVYADEVMEVDDRDKSAGDGTSTRSMDSASITLPMTTITSHPVYRASRPRRGSPVSRWGSDVWTRVIVASALALSLQWGTTGAAFMIVWFTPTKGLGCRSGAYLLYGLTSTLVWLIMLLSSIFAHYSHLPHPNSHHLHLREVVDETAARLSVALRRLGKFVATLNAIWIVVVCLFQFSNFFDRCYCDSSVIGLGKRAFYTLLLTEDDIPVLRGAWIGAIVLALGSAFSFVGAIILVKDPPLPES